MSTLTHPLRTKGSEEGMWEGAYRESDLRRGLPIGLRGKSCIPITCMIGLERAEGDQRYELVKGRKKRGKER